jgi:hypothetical protein
MGPHGGQLLPNPWFALPQPQKEPAVAAPVITGLHAPTTAVAGTPYDITVDANDPAARAVDLTATVANAAGEQVQQSVTVEVGSGALTYTLTTTDANTVITAGATAGSFVVTSN